MAQTFETPNMHMDLPVVQGEVGPLWAQELNVAIGTVIDAHDHTSGNGVQVPVAGLNIDDDLDMNDHQLTDATGVELTAIAQPSAGTSEATIYRTGDDLYWQDGSGNNVRLTAGGAIVPNGTGDANGFYEDYASSLAHASYYSATASYQFYQNDTETLRATGVFSQLQSIQATQNDFYLATGGGYAGASATSPTGGWRFRARDGTLQFGSAAAASSLYSTVAQLAPLSDGTADLALAINDTTSNTPLSVTKTALSMDVKQVAVLRVLASGIGTPATGLGVGQRFWESSENKAIGEIRGYYSSKTTSSNGAGGVRILGAYNGSIDTVGLDVVRFSSASAIGLLGAAVSGQGVTVYGDLVPSASGGLLGTASLPWLIRGTSGTFSSSVTANGFIATGTSAMQTINAATSSTYGLGNSAATWLNVWGDTTRSITHILRDANPSTKTQSQTYAGIIHWAAAISSGAAVSNQYTANNSISGAIAHVGSSGKYEITLTTPIPSGAVILAMVSDDNDTVMDAAGYVTSVCQVSTTQINVYIRELLTANGTDLDFSITVLSTGL